MIKNTLTLDLDELPSTIDKILDLLDQQESLREEDLENEQVYAQSFTDEDGETTQIHLGYFLEDLAVLSPEVNFKQEFYLAISHEKEKARIMYESEPMEIVSTNDNHDQKLIHVGEDLLREMAYELDDDGLFSWRDLEERFATA